METEQSFVDDLKKRIGAHKCVQLVRPSPNVEGGRVTLTALLMEGAHVAGLLVSDDAGVYAVPMSTVYRIY